MSWTAVITGTNPAVLLPTAESLEKLWNGPKSWEIDHTGLSCSFCSACIQHWAQIESKCPFCKARFTSISRKVLDLEKLPDSDAESDDTVRQRFPGTVLDTFAVPERNQVCPHCLVLCFGT